MDDKSYGLANYKNMFAYLNRFLNFEYMRSILILTSLCAILVTSCGTTNNKGMDKTDISAVAITDAFWKLETLGKEQITHPEDSRVIGFQLDATEGRVSGYSGCNNFMGGYTLGDNSAIEFSKMASTRMACFQAPFEEQLMLNVFDQADGYTIKNNRLEIKKGSLVLATFTKVEKDEKVDIVEKYWKLKTLDGKEVTMTEDQEREVHFILKSSNNTINGYAGCNTFSGEFEMNDDNQFTTSRMKSTLRICPDSNFNEDDFLMLFRGPVSYEAEGDTLFFLDAEGSRKASFEAVYFD